MPPVLYHLGRFPPSALEWPALIPLIGPAAPAVARYDAMLAAVPNADVLLSPLTTQEPVLSSRRALRGDGTPRRGADAVPVRHPSSRLDLRTPDLSSSHFVRASGSRASWRFQHCST